MLDPFLPPAAVPAVPPPTLSPQPEVTPILTGEELRTLRRRAGLLQRELANELHYHQSRVSQWERGASPIPASVARELLHIVQSIERDRALLRALLKSSFL